MDDFSYIRGGYEGVRIPLIESHIIISPFLFIGCFDTNVIQLLRHLLCSLQKNNSGRLMEQ